MNDYYNNYQLDGVAVWELNKDIIILLDTYIFLVDNAYSLRVV